MRHLHPVAANEVFVASGVYQQFLRGTKVDWQESWNIHELGGAGKLIRIDQDGRFYDGRSTLAEILMNEDGRVERLNIRIEQSGESADYRSMQTDYIFLDQYAQVSRQIDGGERTYEEIPLPDEVFVRLLDFNLMWGIALNRSIEPGANALQIFVPFSKPGIPVGQVLQGMLPEVSSVQDEMLPNTEIAAKRFETGGRRAIWLDHHRIPLRIDQSNTNTIYLLSNYAHRQVIDEIL